MLSRLILCGCYVAKILARIIRRTLFLFYYNREDYDSKSRDGLFKSLFDIFNLYNTSILDCYVTFTKIVNNCLA